MFVIVELWEGRSLEQKREMVRRMTDVLVETVGANPKTLHIAIHEVPKTAWGRDGRLSCDAGA